MKLKKRIARTLLIYILLFSGVLTIFIAAIQLNTEINRDLDNIERQFTSIEKNFSPALARALWEFNEEAIQIQIEGIANLGDIEYVKVTDEDNKSIITGEKPAKHPITRHIFLTYKSKEKNIEVGKLTVIASKTKVYERFLARLTVILFSQAVKTFLVSIFIFFIVHYIVIKHLAFISSFLKQIEIAKPPSPLNLQRNLTSKKDELDQVVLSINEMVERQHKSFWEVEQIVVDRTSELTSKNEQLRKEITIRKQAESQVIRKNRLLDAINMVFQEALTCETEEDLGQRCLHVAEELTASNFGFIGQLNEEGLFDTLAISNPGWDRCRLHKGQETVMIRNMPIRGVDRATLREGVSRIVNGRDSILNHPDHVVIPEGHPPIETFLGVPLKYEKRTIGMIGLANKKEGYTHEDQENVEALSVAIVESLKGKRAVLEREKLIIDLQTALGEIKTLRGILPICSYCKKVRDDRGYWQQVDVYIQRHSDADISHSICQDCLKDHYPKEYKAIQSKK